jgi:hypothetical protein
MKHLPSGIAALLLGSTWVCGNSVAAQTNRKPAAAAAQRATATDPCTLVTQAEAETIMGEKLAHPTMRSGGCWFGESLAFSFVPLSPASSAEFEAIIKKDVDRLNAKMRKLGAKESTIDRVTDLDAPAFYVDPTLLVYRNQRVLSVFADRPRAIAAARKALERWK